MPRRARLLGAKAVVTGAYALVTGLVAAFASFFAVQALLAGAGVAYATLGDPGVLRAVIGAALYLTLIALMGLGLGALTRSTSGALGTLVGVTLLVPAVAPALPGAVGQWMARFWPTTAGQDAYAVVHAMGALGRARGTRPVHPVPQRRRPGRPKDGEAATGGKVRGREPVRPR